ncbi:MAG: hypothetical protein F4X82_02875 [Candidatus Spechtbacteria bacterium SB0662_bin_43]|uniref:Peptidase A2 domain-containing protein n=1 Tax=Candidatus Spechtbacteria bacterium SB0662_bin_43 TaxID=2604897 RepID=A0A845DCP3_9BACT|nr:hypothetical protein [Candidatus Spechtbacteria bacterium SB0662_bin_43]
MPYFTTELKDDRFLIKSWIEGISRVEQIELDLNKRVDLDTDQNAIKLKTIEGLIDTGATHSCITEEVASELEIPVLTRNMIGTAGNDTLCSFYKAILYIPIQSSVDKKMHYFAKTGTFAGLPEQKKHRGYDCIIGMDILSHFTFQYANGQLTMGW